MDHQDHFRCTITCRFQHTYLGCSPGVPRGGKGGHGNVRGPGAALGQFLESFLGAFTSSFWVLCVCILQLDAEDALQLIPSSIGVEGEL